MTRPSIRRRPARTAASLVSALVLLGIAVVGVWVGMRILLTGAEGLPAVGRELRWNSPGVMALALALLLAGFLIVVAAVRPGPPLVREIRSAAVLRSDAGGSVDAMDGARRGTAGYDDGRPPTATVDVRRIRTYVSTRGLVRIAEGEASRIGGIGSERVRWRRGGLRLRAVSTGEDVDVDRRFMHARILGRLDELRLRRPGRVRVRLHRGGRS